MALPSAVLAVDRVFARFGIDAVHHDAGGATRPVRVMRSAPDAVAEFSDGRFVTDTLTLRIRIAQLPDLARGDVIEIDGENFVIRGAPVRDGERLVWSAEAAPQ